MISFEKYSLDNGLKVILHQDKSTPMAAVNTLYDVGARDEKAGKTGFAHLFEHLMFGGSVNIEEFDRELQKAGGESNAFTSNDLTNYYEVLPAQNLDTALWLESDRMLSLAFTEKSLEVQRNVVIEEFKQRYLNQPFGDVWLQLRPLVYTTHPYRWATIGEDISHIEKATMNDVRSFFDEFYHPANAVLCVAGNFDLAKVKDQIRMYYESIPGSKKPARLLPAEPPQIEFRSKSIYRDVPANAFYYAFKMPIRKSIGFYLGDLLSDALGKDNSSILSIRLKKELELVSGINAYITGSLDDGLFVICGKLLEDVPFEKLDEELWKELDKIKKGGFSETRVDALKNKINTARAFQEQGLLNRSMNLCYFELLGDANGINEEDQIYQSIQQEDLLSFAKDIFVRSNCSLLKVHQNAG